MLFVSPPSSVLQFDPICMRTPSDSSPWLQAQYWCSIIVCHHKITKMPKSSLTATGPLQLVIATLCITQKRESVFFSSTRCFWYVVWPLPLFLGGTFACFCWSVGEFLNHIFTFLSLSLTVIKSSTSFLYILTYCTYHSWCMWYL